MNKIFRTMALVGALILLYTGATGGISVLLDYGFVPALDYIFNPIGFGLYGTIITLAQDILLVVGLVGMLVTKRNQDVEQVTAESLNPE